MAQIGNTNGFQKGYDAKRFIPTNKGLTEFHLKLGELLRSHSLAAINFILNTMKDEDADPKLRLIAAIEILNRGLGKPVDVSVIATLNASKAQDITELSNAELTEIINRELKKDHN